MTWSRRVQRLLALAAVLIAVPASAQSGSRLELLPESRVRVDGTSNKNDWSVPAPELSGWVMLSAAGDALEVSAGSFTVGANSMKSEHGVIMDRLMHNALRASQHPQIVYELASATATPAGNGRFELATRGRLTLAGVTKEIEGLVLVERQADGSLRFTGSHQVDMPEYDIKPPTAMFGALRTGRAVTVHFDLRVRPQR